MNKSETNISDLEKSIWRIFSSYLVNKDKFKRFNCIIHTPAKRLNPTFLIYLIFYPKNCYFIISKGLVNSFQDFRRFFIDLFENKIKDKMNFELKSEYLNLPKNLNNVNLIILDDKQFNNYEQYKEILSSKIIELSNKFKLSEILIDITGGKKLHSAICVSLCEKYHIAYSYLDVVENREKDGLFAESGTETIYINYPDEKRLYYLSLLSFPVISILNNEISCFYDGKSFTSKFNFDDKNKKSIIKSFTVFSKDYAQYLSKNLEAMLNPDLNNITENIKKSVDQKFLLQLENVSSKSRLIAISLDKKYWNFPFEFLFNKFDDFIILRSIPEALPEKNKSKIKNTYNNITNVLGENILSDKDLYIVKTNNNDKINDDNNNYKANYNNNDKAYDDNNNDITGDMKNYIANNCNEDDYRKNIYNKRKKESKILISCFSNDNLMQSQFKEIKNFFDKNLQKEVIYLNIPSKIEFIKAIKNCGIAHIICHGKILDNKNEKKQVFILEKKVINKSNIKQEFLNNDDYIDNYEYIEKDDFENIISPYFIFISACSSLAINISWENTIYSKFAENGCKTIIGTHWSVTQKHSSMISIEFYKKFIEEGKPVGMALHEALKKLNNPFISRNYYLIGDHKAMFG
ncbi:MAG: CHAT domain-containing protein [Exilispira sp.]